MALTIGLLAHVSRQTRSSVIEALDSDYVKVARARGFSEWAVTLRHALRNAMLPTITVLAQDVGFLIGGIVAVETIFAYPGVGRLLVFALARHDLPLMQAAILVLTAVQCLATSRPTCSMGFSTRTSAMVDQSPDDEDESPERRRRPVPPRVIVCALLPGLMILAALCADRLAPFPFDQMHVADRLEGLSFTYLAGTDEYGRDVFSRTLYGSRLSLFLGFVATLIGLSVGVPLGRFGAMSAASPMNC
jgi:ABC-type dipeptide/oligopeptide/nickel transport system permease component